MDSRCEHAEKAGKEKCFLCHRTKIKSYFEMISAAKLGLVQEMAKKNITQNHTTLNRYW